MKKIYPLLISGAIALTAGARTPVESKFAESNILPDREIRTSSTSLESGDVSSVGRHRHSLKLNSVRKADGMAVPEGKWTFEYFDGWFDDASQSIVYIEYDATLDNENYLYFTPDGEYYIPFYLYYDEQASNMILEAMYIGYTSQYYISQEPFVVNNLTQEYEFPDELTIPYDAEAGILEVDSWSGIVWGGYTIADKEYIGDFDGYYFESAYMGNAPEIPEGGSGGNWETVGKATFMDGWVLPAFNIDQTDEANWYEVELQRNSSNDSRFRLVDPYRSGPAAKYNECQTQGFIVFDVSDPEHVVFEFADAGFVHAAFNLYNFYCYNALGMYKIFFEEYTVEQLVEKLGDYCPYTSFKDGVVSLGHVVNEDGIWYDANFGDQYNPYGGFDWKFVFGGSWDGNMTAAIIFPEGWDDESGIGLTEMEATTASEYYTLQGLRVERPARGQLLIRKQGSSVEKVIF